MMSLKRKFFEENADGRDCKQRQRMTTYHLNNIFQTTQQKLYEGSKNFFRKLKESTIANNEQQSCCCSSMHCVNSSQSSCEYCEKRFCSNHLTQCSQCNKTYCLYCSTNNNQSSICLTCIQNQ